MWNLLFGAAYYPEYMPCDRMKKDMEMMKRAGMNTLRIAESTWSSLEPEDGKFNFSYIDRSLEAHGIRNVALCAFKLKLVHPKSGEEMLFVIKPSGDVFRTFEKEKGDESRNS